MDMFQSNRVRVRLVRLVRLARCLAFSLPLHRHSGLSPRQPSEESETAKQANF